MQFPQNSSLNANPLLSISQTLAAIPETKATAIF
jgi:hypothetical protein